jgi:hypothetical protein
MSASYAALNDAEDVGEDDGDMDYNPSAEDDGPADEDDDLHTDADDYVTSDSEAKTTMRSWIVRGLNPQVI